MTDIAVIILQKNEILHIKRCLDRILALDPKQVFVVDCFSTDGSDVEVEKMAETETWNGRLNLVRHEWPGFYAKQFNWAIDNLPIKATWVLRLDADEYLCSDTIEEVRELLNSGKLPADVSSMSITLNRYFCNKEIRHSGTGVLRLVRFFRYGIGRCEDRAMDEHIITSEGRNLTLKGGFFDHNLNTMEWWKEKHRGYAKREAADAIAFERGEVRFKPVKEAYYRMPRYFRAFAYFFLRYVVRGGFLDGYAGWMWNFWQGLWYRCLVDREIGRLRRSR